MIRLFVGTRVVCGSAVVIRRRRVSAVACGVSSSGIVVRRRRVSAVPHGVSGSGVVVRRRRRRRRCRRVLTVARGVVGIVGRGVVVGYVIDASTAGIV